MNTGELRTNAAIETTDNVDCQNQPKPDEDADYIMESFKLARYSNRANDINLLRDPRNSVFGDICINVENNRYILDRVILASKSRHLEYLFLKYDDDEIQNVINSLIEGDSGRFSSIVEIIYGKDLSNSLNEHNFVQLFIDMDQIDMEIDLEIFKQFIDEKIQPKMQLNNSMFRLFNYMSNFSAVEMKEVHKYDYLLPTLGRYFSDRLAKVYRRRDFLSMSLKALCLILMNENTSSGHSLDFVIHVCAEWICHQNYRYRMKMSKEVVNAIKYRFELFPYSNWDTVSVIRSLKINGIFDRPNVEQMEKVLIQLIEHSHYHGDIKFVLPFHLKAETCNLNPGRRKVNEIDQTTKWMSYFEKSQFCDVIVYVHGFETGFKLHRAKLSSASEYFYDLFTKSNQLLTSEGSSDDESTLKKYLIQEIDQTTFKNLILCIYELEIQVTSLTELKCLLCGSKFLKMNDVYEKCSSKMLEIIDDLFTDDIFYLFQFVCENDKYSELYNEVVKRILDLWPDLDEVPELNEITLTALREIVALPQLKFDNEEVDR